MYEVRFDRDMDFGRKDRLAIFLFKDGKEYIVEPLVFREIKTDQILSEPTFESRSKTEFYDLLRAFVKAAEAVGIRSEGEAKLKGLLEAKEAHLQDLRALVPTPVNKTLAEP